MTCKKCGASISGTDPFCANCGNPLKEAPTQPIAEPLQPPINNPISTPIASSKRADPAKTIGIIVALFTIVMALVLLFESNGYSTPEEAAENYVEGLVNADFDQILDSIHPDMRNAKTERSLKRECEERKKYNEKWNVRNPEITIERGGHPSEYIMDEIEEIVEDKFDLELRDVLRIDAYAKWTEGGISDDDEEYSFYAIKIGEKWYVYDSVYFLY